MFMNIDRTNILRGVDEAYELAHSGWVREGMDHLSGALWSLRRSVTTDAWRDLCKVELLNHPMRKIAHRCPIALRSFEKPRGYPGDAVTLDYIYGIYGAESPPPVDAQRAAYESRFGAPAARAVRFRRGLMAKLVRDARRENPGARVLSVASGHLREADFVFKMDEDAMPIGPWWTAFDQDEKSLEVAERSYGTRGVAIQKGSVRDAIAGRSTWGTYSLVYAAGLFDYLPQPAAIALLARMIASTQKGGTVMIANFAQEIPDVGYMESYMAWDLIYRSEDEMTAMVNAADKGRIESLDISRDPDRNIIFAIMRVR